MEVVTEYADQKTELEEKVGALEAERESLINDIGSLKEKLATLELERRATSIEGEMEALRTEKAVLEEKIASYAMSGTEAASSTTEGYQV